MSATLFSWIALGGLCFGLGTLLIRHIFEDSGGEDASSAAPRGTRHGWRSGPALGCFLLGFGASGAVLRAAEPLADPWLTLAALAGGAVVTAILLPCINRVLRRATAT